MLYADDPYFRKPPIIDEQCGINILSGSISVEELQQLGKSKVWCSPKMSGN
jgi:hypothetical protein